MELKVKSYTLPEALEFNYEELKAEITERVSQHTNLVYTNDQITDAKKDVAMLRKFTKALSDERIRIKKDFLKPYEDFEKKIKELTGIVDQAINNIDVQIKAADEQRKAEKLESIREYIIRKDIPEGITLPVDPKWLNVSVSMASIQKDIDTRLEQINTDLATLSNLPEFAFEACEVYKSSLDLNKSICEAHRLSEQAKRKAEYEAEHVKRKAEAEFAKYMNPPVEKQKQEAVVSYAEKAAEPEKQWISFKALLSVGDAEALKDFFESRNIEFEAI